MTMSVKKEKKGEFKSTNLFYPSMTASISEKRGSNVLIIAA